MKIFFDDQIGRCGQQGDIACRQIAGDIPAARTSAEIPAMKLLKSPPQRAAWEGVRVRVRAKRRMESRRTCMGKWFLEET